MKGGDGMKTKTALYRKSLLVNVSFVLPKEKVTHEES